MSQIQPADRSARRKAILIISVAAAVACLLIFAFESYRPDIEAWFLDEPERLNEKFNWIIAVFAVLSIPLLLFAVYFWRIGQSIINARRFPPPGIAVVVDTPIITGKKAIFKGRLLKFALLILAACSVAVPTVFWWISQMLLGNT